ncbi:nucleoprotein [Agrotis ipsilon virus]|nr:nucleoprotein [Agrotis ipsilon virus]
MSKAIDDKRNQAKENIKKLSGYEDKLQFARCQNLFWKDSVLEEIVSKYTFGTFDISVYVSCVRWVMKVYSGEVLPSQGLQEAFAYLIMFARKFSDPTTLANEDPKGSKQLPLPKIPASVLTGSLSERETKTSSILNQGNGPVSENQLSPEEDNVEVDSSQFWEALEKLLNDIKEGTNDTGLSEAATSKYQILNNNITYLILLMYRRITKQEGDFATALSKPRTSENYTKLCPGNLSLNLPMISGALNRELVKVFSNSKDAGMLITCLILRWYKSTYDQDARGTGEDRMILQATCLLHLGGTGLGMMSLISAAANSLQLTVADLASKLYYDSTEKSIMTLTKVTDKWTTAEYSSQHTRLFPWCRLVNQDYHSSLSATENPVICYALTIIIDHVLGKTVSNARSALWVKSIAKKNKNMGADIASTFNRNHDNMVQTPLHDAALPIIKGKEGGEDHKEDLDSDDEEDADDSYIAVPPKTG